jgi:hypothetical protein
LLEGALHDTRVWSLDLICHLQRPAFPSNLISDRLRENISVADKFGNRGFFAFVDMCYIDLLIGGPQPYVKEVDVDSKAYQMCQWVGSKVLISAGTKCREESVTQSMHPEYRALSPVPVHERSTISDTPK